MTDDASARGGHDDRGEGDGGMGEGRGATAGTAGVERWRAYPALLAFAAVLVLSLALLPGVVGAERPAGPGAPPRSAAQQSPEPSTPMINPVGDGDANTVRPEEPAATVAGLPISGTGPTPDATGTVRLWTTLAMLALALNAAVLLVLAGRSLRGR